MVKYVPIEKLKPHPRNEAIYGQEEVSDLVVQIQERMKIVIPIVVNKDNVILSGHRRFAAAKALKFTKVPCEVRTFESPEDELEFLLHSNVTRKKTKEQRAREGLALEEVLAGQSLERRKANLKQYRTERADSSLSGETGSDSEADDIGVAKEGRTRDEVAKALRIGSGKLFDNMRAVIKRADDLKAQGNAADSELLLVVLNRSPSAAYDLLKVDMGLLSDEVKADVKSGKVAPRSLLPTEQDKKEEKPTVITPHRKAINNARDLANQVSLLAESLTRAKDHKHKQAVYRIIRKQIETLQGLLPTEEISEPNTGVADKANSKSNET